MLEEQGERIEGRLTSVEGQLVSIDGRLTKVEGQVESLRDEMRRLNRQLREDLVHQMGVFYENTMAAIRDLAPDFRPIRREFKSADAVLREDIERRLEPLEAEARTRRNKPNG